VHFSVEIEAVISTRGAYFYKMSVRPTFSPESGIVKQSNSMIVKRLFVEKLTNITEFEKK